VEKIKENAAAVYSVSLYPPFAGIIRIRFKGYDLSLAAPLVTMIL